jgi:hypothetical protein
MLRTPKAGACVDTLFASLDWSGENSAEPFAYWTFTESEFGRGAAGVFDRLHEFMVWLNPVSRLDIRCYLRALMSQYRRHYRQIIVRD